jgi:uncharacterized protein (DUF58 family)
MRGRYWLYIAVLLFVVSLIIHQIPLLLISVLFLFAGGISRLWGRYCLSRVEYQRRLSTNCVFFGEEVQLEVEVVNRKLLPLPWIQIDDEVPEAVILSKTKTSPSPEASHVLLTDRMLLTNVLSMNWYHKVKRRYQMHCLHRGYFAFGPARLYSGDLFGFFRRETEVQALDYLMVYPKILPLEKLGIPSTQPLGDIRTRNYLFQDPILTMGVRDYHSGDSLKHIHWKSTARLGQMQTRVFEPTTTIDMGIFLDVRTTEKQYWGHSIPQLLELVVIVAASIASYARTNGYCVGLYSNGNLWFSPELIRIPPSQHPDQMRYILEALAKVQPVEIIPISNMIVDEVRNLPWGSSLVVISAIPSGDLLATLLNMKRAGRKVALIVVGDAGTSISVEGLEVYYVREDVDWRELESVQIGSK